jgi:cytochrome c-type biogenesis protein CcmH
VDPDDVVYVVAKTDNNPMPLAVLRRSAAELPFDFVLSDDNSMVQGGGISSANTVTVSARLSKTGDALNTATELGVSSAAIDPSDSGNLTLVIDVVPGG